MSLLALGLPRIALSLFLCLLLGLPLNLPLGLPLCMALLSFLPLLQFNPLGLVGGRKLASLLRFAVTRSCRLASSSVTHSSIPGSHIAGSCVSLTGSSSITDYGLPLSSVAGSVAGHDVGWRSAGRLGPAARRPWGGNLWTPGPVEGWARVD